MRYFVMFVTAVCVLFLLKLKWPKNKSFYETEEGFCLACSEEDWAKKDLEGRKRIEERKEGGRGFVARSLQPLLDHSSVSRNLCTG